MTKLEFDDEFSQLMEEFNSSAGAVERRARIIAALDLKLGAQVLDVGSGRSAGTPPATVAGRRANS